MRQRERRDAARARAVVLVIGLTVLSACVTPAAAPAPVPDVPVPAATTADGPGGGRRPELRDTALTAATEWVARAPRSAAAPALAALDAPDAAGHATVDVLIVYGSATTELYSAGSIETIARQAVARANLAFYASRIGVQLRLVGAVDLRGAEAELASLERLRSSPVVDRLRTATGADLVQAWGDYPGTCGQAYQHQGTPIPEWGFSAVSARCVLSVAPVHEWGHNLGAGHDRVTDADHPDDRALPDAYGHVSPSGFATIMAYDNGTCPASGCERIYLFSNPAVGWRGVPSGEVDRAHNARAIHAMGPGVAAYRAAVR